ncbi:hypothetical protein DPMN_171387 [Dreissena polymorpha]|uniref:Uncharacterized protein n=1 Tax=Dreissena polymorpha TaxID=45954 RepID=A0A9D4IF41_DREPO|nr:hypothetical protein DPMN_171387 [Dreissena polymorpha]
MDKATSLQIPDEVGDPSDLGGVPVTEDDVQRKEDIPKSSEHFFPSFHETPKQTANIIDSGYSLFQEFQMHREKLIEFYENNKRDILENKNNKRNQFIFYAQHIGLTHEEIKQYLIDCLSETQSQTGNVPRQSDPRPSHDCPSTVFTTANRRMESLHKTSIMAISSHRYINLFILHSEIRQSFVQLLRSHLHRLKMPDLRIMPHQKTLATIATTRISYVITGFNPYIAQQV